MYCVGPQHKVQASINSFLVTLGLEGAFAILLDSMQRRRVLGGDCLLQD